MSSIQLINIVLYVFVVSYRSCNSNALSVLYTLAHVIQSSSSEGHENASIEILRALLAVEFLLRTTLLELDIYQKVLSDQLTILSCDKKNNTDDSIYLKSKKILLIIQGLMKYRNG